MYLLTSHLLERLSSSNRLCKAQQVYHTLSQTSIPCNGMPVLRTRNLPFKSPEVHYTSFLILSIHLLKQFRPTNVICLRTCNIVPKPQCIFWTVNFQGSINGTSILRTILSFVSPSYSFRIYYRSLFIIFI